MKNELKKNSLFSVIQPVANALKMDIVEIQKIVLNSNSIKVVLTVQKSGEQTRIEDLEIFHKSVRSVLELLIGRDVLSTEVVTPGLSRNIKDCSEFALFKGRNVKIFVTSLSEWIEGVIKCSTETSVSITDKNNKEINIGFDEIKKAKLIYF